MKNYSVKTSPSQLDVFSTFLPLYTILNIFGLSRVCLSGGHLKITSNIFKHILITILLIFVIVGSCISYYMSIGMISDLGTSLSFVQMFHLLFNIQYFFDIYSVHEYGGHAFLRYIAIYQTIDKSLGVISYKEIKKNILEICLTMFAIVPLTAVFDFIYSVVTLGWLVSIVYTVQYMFYLFKILNTLEMVSHICQIKYRLKYIGDLLKYYHYYYDYMTEVHQHLSYRKHFFINKGNELNQISRCYLLISKQTNYINNMYGFRVKKNALQNRLHHRRLTNKCFRVHRYLLTM